MLPAPQLPAKILHPAFGGTAINSRICVCCGEPMIEQGNALSRNPNVCTSCSSLADGMEADVEMKGFHEILP